MLYHLTCSNIVFLDLHEGIKLIATPGINSSHLTIGLGEVLPTATGKVASEFYCPTCGKNVELKELYIYCGGCGNKIPLMDHPVKDGESGALYCQKCAHNFHISGNDASIIAKNVYYPR